MSSNKQLFTVTGGYGFIGSHIANRLLERGERVRIVDLKEGYIFGSLANAEFIRGDIRNPEISARAVAGADIVLHFAAVMGGMGVIHDDNDAIIYRHNHDMLQQLLHACKQAGTKMFFYASSACVYPDNLQDKVQDIALNELCAYQRGVPPSPQGLYGLQKLHGEELVRSHSSMDVRIARFHNVYGPHGSWADGHEKAPAALLRKAIAIDLGAEPQLEIWGDGDQRRSFLFITDAIDAIIRLLESAYPHPVNIGSEEAISIQGLAECALKVTRSSARSTVTFSYEKDKPLGVGARRSENTLAREVLGGWEPRVSLEEGMRQTGQWIRSQMVHHMGGLDARKRQDYLHQCLQSRLIDLNTPIVFAILLPITSRGLDSKDACLENLTRFARSLQRTTLGDRHNIDGDRFKFRVYLAIDHDDSYLLTLDDQGSNRAEIALLLEGIHDVVTLDPPPQAPRGHVCELWRLLARRAAADKCDYYVLMGDDVELLDEGWMQTVHDEFKALEQTHGAPAGFGCVAFCDVSFPGMPTFPVISATHMQIFQDEVVPQIFKNQDGDPFLFQLYRRWGCSRMMSPRLSNGIGGGGAARYEKESAVDWTFDTLSEATDRIETWLYETHPRSVTRKLTLDVVIASFRVPLPLLERILKLQSSPTCMTNFIIIIDDPASSATAELVRRFGTRPDVRIRVNSQNLGASLSRNRGLYESAAEWVFFLDDDVHPEDNVLLAAEDAIRAAPDAAGFIGSVKFPPATSIFTACVHLAGVLFFWDIADKWQGGDDMPWGVTACLIARRNVKDGVQFNPSFPKTGGGEDIDYCRQKRRAIMERGGQGFLPAPAVRAVHPWWNDGRPSFWRFFMWSVGDGALLKMYTDLTYPDLAPSSAELFLLALAGSTLGICGVSIGFGPSWLVASLGFAACVILANVMHDLYRHLWRDAARIADLNTNIRGAAWLAAIVLSTVVRLFSEAGRTGGIVRRGEFDCLGRRFEWFAGRWGKGPMDEERKNSFQRFGLAITLWAVIVSVGW